MDWKPLETRFGEDLIKRVRARLLSGSSPQITCELFVSDYPREVIQELFNTLTAAGILRKLEKVRCLRCGQPLEDPSIANGICPHCEYDFAATGETPFKEDIYLISGQLSREIPWLIAIHGFKTHGEWQEEFGWLLATRFKHRAPALMYKFPYLTFGVLFRFRHKALARRLTVRIRRSMERARECGIADPPDIIAHSFGSLLFSLLLESPASADLQFGRVILAGAIVRPDYDWSSYLRTGKIQAVLNHCSRKDRVVDFAQWFIPRSGPSGRVGFRDASVFNLREEEFGHGTHFEPDTMISSLALGGPWDEFLRLPVTSLAQSFALYRPPKPWRPIPGFLKVMCWIAGTLLSIALILIIGEIAILAFATLARFLGRV